MARTCGVGPKQLGCQIAWPLVIFSLTFGTLVGTLDVLCHDGREGYGLNLNEGILPSQAIFRCVFLSA